MVANCPASIELNIIPERSVVVGNVADSAAKTIAVDYLCSDFVDGHLGNSR